MTPPALTVFTPFYTNVEYIDETIASVLSQSFPDFEYLLINDGDPSNAQRIERAFPDARLRVITTDSYLGLTALRNKGLSEGRGEFIAFIDSDDFCEPDRFRKQIEFLRAHQDHVLVGSAIRYVDEKSRTIGTRRYPETDEAIKTSILIMNCIAQPAVMARRQALLAAGGYDDEFRHAEDYGLWLRLARSGKFHNLQEELVAYRLHSGATKNTWLKAALRDTTRLKVRAIRDYGFKPTPRALLSIAGHALLLLVPSRIIFWLFRKMIVIKNGAPL